MQHNSHDEQPCCSGSGSGPPPNAPDPTSWSAPPEYTPPTVYRLVFFAPSSQVKVCERAIFAVGAGRSAGGDYTEAATYYSDGAHQKYRPRGLKPNFVRHSESGVRVETTCVGRDVARSAVEALIAVYPQAELSYQLYKVESLDDMLG
ncbi:uncharacterized protein B0I36DRAFT_343104 [Microdochium trichocladiopsis]|uniref:ATP phosphoribosyltransferase n=1 Tax=Microdochium trichocladiopsis TaxID=1682393 RepID=A0A9P8XP15_9PEZI|nr:uncharacterized protein B0I36DRAFT_343104 [Microdochium trichocladiopsis]KAH7007953.1 hypothetical protein B0I36DRAFT_343104 [Microdochium trichocladiopsis]